MARVGYTPTSLFWRLFLIPAVTVGTTGHGYMPPPFDLGEIFVSTRSFRPGIPDELVDDAVKRHIPDTALRVSPIGYRHVSFSLQSAFMLGLMFQETTAKTINHYSPWISEKLVVTIDGKTGKVEIASSFDPSFPRWWIYKGAESAETLTKYAENEKMLGPVEFFATGPKYTIGI